MRAYLIDPEKRSIEAIDFSGNFKEIQKLIGDVCFDVVMLPDDDAVYVDDEGLLKPQGYFFKLGRYHTLAGKGLVLGTDGEGESAPVKITIAELSTNVVFMTAEELGLDPTRPPIGQPQQTSWRTAQVIAFR